MNIPRYCRLSQAVKIALSKKNPILALQSTIISHGMPYPQNFKCANRLEQIVKSYNVVPATIALINGQIVIGLSNAEMQMISQQNRKVRKVSKRDISICLLNKEMGATTVAATMFCANLAGIKLFATGGIGGVHRGVSQTMDISADLTQLSRTKVAVVSAGVKSVLDIPKTLQYLQTLGVPVATIGNQQFPAFFSSSSGIKSPFVLQNQYNAAQFLNQHFEFDSGGALIAVPNSYPQSEKIQKAIANALSQAEQQKISGHKITPFLLKRISQLSKGQSLKSNISLIQNNVNKACLIAKQMYKTKQFHFQFKKLKQKLIGPLIIGGSSIDTNIYTQSQDLNKTNPCKFQQKFGGVARNIAQAIGRAGLKNHFITAIGNDQKGQKLIKYMEQYSNIHPIKVENIRSGRYFSVSSNGKLLTSYGNNEINSKIKADKVKQFMNRYEMRGSMAVLDCNCDSKDLKQIIQLLNEQGCQIWLQGTKGKTQKVNQQNIYKQIKFLKVNKFQNSLLKFNIDQYFNNNGLIIVTNQNQVNIFMPEKSHNFKSKKINPIRQLGAGDTLTGVCIACLHKGYTFEQSIKIGMIGAVQTITGQRGEGIISNNLQIQYLKKKMQQ